LGENARFSANMFGARGQQVNVHTYSISPHLFRRFADGSRAGLRYRFSQAYFGDRRADANPTSGDLLNNSSTQEASASYQSAELFERLRFVASAYANRTIEDGSTFSPRFEYEQASGQLSAEYAITDRFALSGAAGYDKVDTSATATAGLFDDDKLSGAFWRAGFTARPGRKTYLRAEYGRRYGKEFVSGEFTYNLSDRLQFQAGADRRFETRAQTVGSQFAGLQQDTLEFVDRLREGKNLDVRQLIDSANRYSRLRDGIGAQSAGLGAFDSAYAGVRGKWGRTEIGGTASYEKADFGFRRVDSWGGQLDVSRQLSRRLTAYGSAFYRHVDTEFDPALCVTSPFLFGFDVRAPLFNPTTACQDYAIQNGRTDTIGGRVGAKYRVYENLSLFGEYTRTNRLGEFSVLEYKENSFLAGAQLDF
ncbi:MAG: hypothetical protein K2Q06_07105, partial [Parvularculaceae bacterium]|nr:hypothetical protein [Parvularculaceae bacterium]